MTTVLRPYQTTAAAEIRAWARKYPGNGAVLQMPTGAGKTAVFCELLKAAHKKGGYALMAVRGKALVHQAAQRLAREGVPHGIYQGEKSRNTAEKILVCSIDTLYRRKVAPHANLIVLDECHLTLSDSYKWFLSQYPKAFKLGVSATPHHKDGMRHIGDKLIYPASFADLVKQGYLVGARYFVPYVPDLKGVEKSGGDYNTGKLGERSIADEELTANAAMVWDRHLRGVSTLLFAVSVEHARVLSGALAARGARVATITADTPDAERKVTLDALEDGRLDVVASVGVLTTGVDLPSLRAIICCRPTDSYNLWIQILGRGTRPYDKKKHFLCYDLSGNLLRYGPIEAEIVADLDGVAPVPKMALKHCLSCFAIFPAAELDDGACPECGDEMPKRDRKSGGQRVHGLTDNAEVVEKIVEPWEMRLPTLVARAREKGLKKGWVYYMLKGEFGEEVASKAWPRVRALKKWDTRSKTVDALARQAGAAAKHFGGKA